MTKRSCIHLSVPQCAFHEVLCHRIIGGFISTHLLATCQECFFSTFLHLASGTRSRLEHIIIGQTHLKYFFTNLMWARERRSGEQEVAAGGSNPGRTNIQGLKITEKESAASDVCYDVCKLLDFLVLTDKDEKPYVPSHSIFIYLVLVGRKRTHTSVRWCGCK